MYRHREENFPRFQKAVQIFTLFLTTKWTFLFCFSKQWHFSNGNWDTGCFLPGEGRVQNQTWTLYHTGLSVWRVNSLACAHTSWKQFTFESLFLFLIKTEVLCKNSARILKPPRKNFFSSLKTSTRLCLLPPLTHIYQTIKAASGQYKKVFLSGGGTKNTTFLSERNKNSLNKVSKGRSH